MLSTSEDTAEMLHNALHQGLYRLLKLKNSSENEIQLELEIITCDPSIFSIYNPMYSATYQVGRVATKPVIGVSDKVIYKLACSATETS